MAFVPSIHVIVASTSGHTDYVIAEVIAILRAKAPAWEVEVQNAEQTKPEDILRGDVLLLAASTWNTGGPEGQLNPHMHALLKERAKDIDLVGKQVAVVGLGDARYRYTAKAADHLEEFVQTHGGKLIAPTLRIINEPYGQEDTIHAWATELLSSLAP